MSRPAYKRILLKISGEVLAGDQPFGIDSRMIDYIASEIAEVAAMGVDVAVVIGGGNIFRGIDAADDAMKTPRPTKYTKLSFLAVSDKRLQVMDSTAISLCMDHNLPIIVFNVKEKGNIKRVVQGEQLGTWVTDEAAPA